MRVLLLCTGNTCRSPMAEALLRGLAPDLEVRSAGVSALPDVEASPHARSVLADRGLDLEEHRARRLGDPELEWADVILAMTEAHRSAVLRRHPRFAGKVFTLRSYGGGVGDIADPYGGTREEYEQTARELEEALLDALARLGQEPGAEP